MTLLYRLLIKMDFVADFVMVKEGFSILLVIIYHRTLAECNQNYIISHYMKSVRITYKDKSHTTHVSFDFLT